MNLKKTTLGVAMIGALSMGVSHQVSANVYAGSGLVLQNLTTTFTNAGAGTQVTSFQFTGTNTATLNGTSDLSPGLSDSCGGTPAANDCGPAGARLNPLAANAPGSAPIRADGDFSLFGPSANTYSNSDSEISSAQLTGDPITATNQIAESEIQSAGDARANAEITSTTGFILQFTVVGGGGLNVAFEADPYLRALINDPAFLNGNSQANLNATFTLTDSSGNSVTWSPQGTAANNCEVDGLAGVTCVETDDGEDLNRNLSTAINPNDVGFSLGAGFSDFGISIDGLSDGEFSLAYNSVTSTSVRLAQVPEPGIIALLGLGMIGMGFTRRKA